MSITHYKNLNLLLSLLICCISARSAPQMLSIKDECSFHFSIFLIIGLCSCSANSLLCIISFLIADLFRVAKVSDRASVADPPDPFLSKNLQTTEARPC